MRILHLDSGREMRGGQWQVLRLIEGLASRGVESKLLARSGSPLYEAARERARERGFQVGNLVRVLGHGYDVVHAHDARSHTIAVLAGAQPLVVSRRVAFPIGSRWKYARARCYIAVSEFVKTVLIDGGVAEQAIRVVYDGVPLLPVGQAVLLPVVLAPANTTDPRKGAALAAEAAALAGADLKFSANLEAELAAAAVFVYITHSEGLGSAALLAMSAGVPVVASRIGGLPEAIRDGENGILVENTPQSIAAAIRRLLDDPAFARQLGDAARETVQSRFTIGNMVERTLSVYHEVLT